VPVTGRTGAGSSATANGTSSMAASKTLSVLTPHFAAASFSDSCPTTRRQSQSHQFRPTPEN
jgi:hypothetical protein